MTGYPTVVPESLAEAQALLRAHPKPRVLGGGTLLYRELAGGPATAALLDLSRLPVTRACRPGRLGAAVTMAALAEADDGGLGATAASIGNGRPDLRARATVGGNCAPEVSGCLYLVLLALGATGVLLTPDGPRQQDLRRWNAARAGHPLLGVRYPPARITFARAEAVPRGPLPLCALAVRPDGAVLTCAIGYAVAVPRVVTLRTGDPWADLRAHLAPAYHEAARRCLTQALA